MCVNRFNIYPKNSTSSSLVYVPCSHCEECRDSQRMQWQFRFRCELDYCKKNGYHIGFFTLTYDDKHIPHLPRVLFKKGKYRKQFCFSRTDVRTFIDNIRKRCHESYKDVVKSKPLRYGIFSEFGDATRRSHYHGLIMFPAEIPDEWIFNQIRRNWTDKGFVFPKDIRGGVDSHGYQHKPFICSGDTEGAANYAAKYACKDLAFYQSLGNDVNVKNPWFKRFKPFHIQSRSLGKCFLLNKSSRELLRLIQDGESFVGQLKTKSLPLYIKNKILYDPKYTFELWQGRAVDNRANDWSWSAEKNRFVYTPKKGTHVRCVSRVATKFFKENFRQIYHQKREYYLELFEQMKSAVFWQNRTSVFSKDCAVNTANLFSSLVKDLDEFTDYYLAYRGKSLLSADPALQWSLRYYDIPLVVNPDSIDCTHFEDYSKACDTVITALRYCTTTDDSERSRLRQILDFYKHQI